MRSLACMIRSCGALTLAFAITGTSPTIAETRFANPNWFVDVTDSGYADYLVYTSGSFPAREVHELLSGEWAAALSYDGLASRLPPPQRAMWLEANWDYPDWLTNSTFTATQPFSVADSDGDGLPEGTAVIDNGDVEITIKLDMQDTLVGTPMGVRGAVPVLSDRYVMLITYDLKNITTGPLTGVQFYQFLQAHPAASQIAGTQAWFDPTLYTGTLSDYRYDVTQRAQGSGSATGAPTGCTLDDHVSLSARVAPTAFGLGSYRGHTVGKPSTGLHLDVENDALGSQTTFGPDEVAGSVRLSIGTLSSGQTKSAQFLLAVRSVNTTPGRFTATACAQTTGTGADPVLLVRKGACSGAQAGSAIDVISGDLRGLAEVTGEVALGAVQCFADDATIDRITVSETMDATCSSARFILARRGAGLQTDWGLATSGAVRIADSGACP